MTTTKEDFYNCFGLNFIGTNKICATTITFSTIFVGNPPNQYGTVKTKVEYFSNLISSYEIESKSNSLLNSELNPKFPAITRNETELNMNILDKWINKNET